MGLSKPPLKPNLLPFQAENVASNQQTAPLPFWGGTRLIAARWLTPALNEITTQVTGGGKKGGGSGGKKGGGASQSKNYYGTIAVAFARGPLDLLKGLVYNGNYIFQNTAGLAITVDVTDMTGALLDPTLIGSGGYLKIYRGTETQPADGAIASGASDLGTFKAVAKNLFFGQDTGTPGNLQAIVSHLPRVPTALVAAADNVFDDEQVNPIAWLAEYFLDEGGGNLPQALFDGPSWLAAAHWCAQDQAHRDYTFCSPLLTEQKSNGEVAKAILDPFNGFLRWTTAGLLACEIYEWGTNPGGLITLDERYMTKRAKFTDGDWTKVKTEVLVSFVDRHYEFQTNTVPVPNARAQQIRQLDDQGKLDRSHITRIEQAHRQGTEYNRRAGTAPGSGTLTVRQPFVAALQIGDKVFVNMNPEPGGTASAQLCRIEKIEQDRTDEATLTVMPDAILPASPYAPVWTPPVPPTALCSPLVYVLGIPIPLAASGWPPAVGFLATRPSQDVLGFQVLFGGVSTLPFADLGNQAGFAARASLAAAIATGDTTANFTELDGVAGPDAELAAGTPGGNAAEAQDDTLIAVLATLDGSGRVALDGSGAAIMEIVSIVSRSAVSGATFAYTLYRARMGTTARAWTAATPVWILPRLNLEFWRHNQFSALQGSLMFFRLMAFNTKAVADVTVPEADINYPPVPAPNTFTGVAGTGRSVSLNWLFTSAASFGGEYGVWRATGPAYTDWAKIAETRSTRFVDAEVAIATTYQYKIAAITPEEGLSGYSNIVTVTTAAVSEIDPAITASIVAAQAAANAAQASANSALTQLTNIASDNILSPVEKPTVIKDYAVLTTEQTGIDAQATAYAITAEKTAYDNAVAALTSYLVGLTTPTAWNDVSGDTTIVGTTFRSNFESVYTTRQTLLNKIYAAAKAIGDAAQTSANTAIANAAAAQTSANSALTQLTNIASDNILSPVEKPTVIKDYAVLTTEQTGIDAQATAYAITAEKTAYDNAVAALTSYLGGLTTPTAWNDVSGDTTIVGTTFRSNFESVYTTRQTLLNLVFTKINPAAPAAPSAPTLASSTFYVAADGTVYSTLVIYVPAIPAGAQIVNILYRKSGAAGWIVGDQWDNVRNPTPRTSNIDDLSPGTAYEVAAQAFSADAVPSLITFATGSPFTAPAKTSAPSNPTGFSGHAPSSSWPVPPQFWGNTQIYGCTVSFTASADKDAVGFEYLTWGSSTSGPSGAGNAVPFGANTFFYYSGTTVPQFLWVRQKDSSGNFQAYVYTGINLNAYLALSAGSMASQDATSVKVNRLYVSSSGASSPTKIDVRVDDQFVVTLAGGARFEEFNVNLTGRGVTGGITTGFGHVIDPANTGIIALFHLAAAGNSNTNAVMTAQTTDGTAIPAGNYRFAINLKQL